MYHDMLSLGTRVHNNQTNPPQRCATKEVVIAKLSQSQKDALPQTDAVSNQSTKTTRLMKTIKIGGTTTLGTCLNPTKMGYALE